MFGAPQQWTGRRVVLAAFLVISLGAAGAAPSGAAAPEAGPVGGSSESPTPPEGAEAGGALGELTQKTGTAGCISESGTGGACQIGRPLAFPSSVTVSPDGKNAYTASFIGDAVLVFDRNPTTGALTQKAGTAGCISETGTAGACQDGKALDEASSVTVSPDGDNAYTAAALSDAVAVFDRNATTGALTQQAATAGCISETGTAGACQDGKALDGAISVTVSPDGKNAYATSVNSYAVAVFDRIAVCAPGSQLAVGSEGEYRQALACVSSETDRIIELTADIVLDDGTDPVYAASQPLRIIGAGHSIDAGGTSRILDHPGSTMLNFDDIIVTGGHADEGGAVRSWGPVTVRGSTFVANTATSIGGAIFPNTGAVTIDESTLLDNHAPNNGGAVYTNGAVTITNSTVSANSADNAAAVLAAGDLTLTHATIADNPGDVAVQTNNALTSFASVIAGAPGQTQCGVGGATTSEGLNYTTDTSCGLGHPTDTANGADPLLGNPRNNGLTEDSVRLTMFPLNGSPLVDFIANEDCSDDVGMVEDQRSIDRPFPLGGACDIGAIEAVFGPHTFSDATPFYEATIRWITSPVNQPNILDGYNNGTFRHTLDITRGQVARMYYRAAGEPPVAGLAPHGFKDVTIFYENSVRWAKANGLFNGYKDNTFRQKNPITRGDVTRSLYNFAGSVPVTGLPPHGFTDVTNFYEPAVRWAKANGLVNGYINNTFRHRNNITRGDASRIFYNLARTKPAWADTMTAPTSMLFKPAPPT